MTRSIIYTVVAIVILVAIGFAARVYIQSTRPPVETEVVERPQVEQNSTDNYDQSYNTGMSFRENSDYVSAADAFESAIESAPDDTEKALAQRRAGVANFLTNDQSKQLVGVQQLKDAVQTAPDPLTKALAISDLASLVCGNGCNTVIFEEVFKDEPYRQFYYADDMTRSVTGLYEWSMEINPVSDAVARATTWYADQLLNAENLTPTVRDEYVSKLDSYVTLAGTLSPRSGARSEIAFYYWIGYAYGGLTTINSEKYGTQFESSYRKSIALGKFEPDGSNKNYAVLFAYYQYAALLDYIYGEARSDDVEANLTALMKSVNGDPNPDTNQFLAMARNEIGVPGLQHGFIGDSLYRLSEKYPDFKSFLESHGLSVD